MAAAQAVADPTAGTEVIKAAAASSTTVVVVAPSNATILANAAAQAQAERARRALEELEKAPLAVELDETTDDPSVADGAAAPPVAVADELAAEAAMGGPPDPHKVRDGHGCGRYGTGKAPAPDWMGGR